MRDQRSTDVAFQVIQEPSDSEWYFIALWNSHVNRVLSQAAERL